MWNISQEYLIKSWICILHLGLNRQGWFRIQSWLLTFRTIQILLVHGCFRGYLWRIARRLPTEERYQCDAQYISGVPGLFRGAVYTLCHSWEQPAVAGCCLEDNGQWPSIGKDANLLRDCYAREVDDGEAVREVFHSRHMTSVRRTEAAYLHLAAFFSQIKGVGYVWHGAQTNWL